MCVKQHTFYKKNQPPDLDILGGNQSGSGGGLENVTRGLAIPDLQSSVMASSHQQAHLGAGHHMHAHTSGNLAAHNHSSNNTTYHSITGTRGSRTIHDVSAVNSTIQVSHGYHQKRSI